MSPQSNDWYPYEEGILEQSTGKKAKAEVVVIYLQTKEHQGSLVRPRSGERGKRWFLPQSPQKEPTLPPL